MPKGKHKFVGIPLPVRSNKQEVNEERFNKLAQALEEKINKLMGESPMEVSIQTLPTGYILSTFVPDQITTSESIEHSFQTPIVGPEELNTLQAIHHIVGEKWGDSSVVGAAVKKVITDHHSPGYVDRVLTALDSFRSFHSYLCKNPLCDQNKRLEIFKTAISERLREKFS